MFRFNCMYGQSTLDYYKNLVCNIFLWLGLITLFNSVVVAGEVNPLNKTTVRVGILPDSAQHIIDARFNPLLSFIEQELDIKIKVVKERARSNLNK